VTLRLAHLSDIHFGGENAVAVEAAVDFVRAFDPSLVIVTGDLTLNGGPREFLAAGAWLARLPQPQLVTPGNHDTPYWNLPLRAAVPFNRYRRYIGAPDQAAFDAPGLSARAVNTARGAQPRLDWSKGAIDLDQVRQAAQQMAAAPAALKVFACHHPLVDLEDLAVTGDVRRGAAAAQALAAAGIDLILTGHVHNPFAQAIPHGAGRTYAVGAGTLSLRTRGAPAGFSTITADADTIIVTALGWNGAGYEPFRTWALPRGPRRESPP
jgi:3',5'-cyclic AMP phosphodiesterase CpdA